MTRAQILSLAALIMGAAAALAWVALITIGTWQIPGAPQLDAGDIEDAIAGCIKITREAAGGV